MCALSALVAALALASPPRAAAAPHMISVLQDDNELIYSGSARREHALERARAFGADAIRVTVLWETLAPRRKPGGRSSPAAYSARDWDRYDELIRGAERRGLKVYFNVTGPGPRWGHRRAPSRRLRRTWKPRPSEFGRFVTAVGRRYSGRYSDENFGGKTLPRVRWWSISNEPNWPGWLTPQFTRTRRGTVPASPALYRDLLNAGARALLRTGHGDDLLLFGETAALGARGKPADRAMPPARFLRELFCLKSNFRRHRGRAARDRRCGNVGKLEILDRFPRLAYGHHPYTRKKAPTLRERRRDAITIANLGRLPKLLDRLARATEAFRSGMPIFLTEFGYETKPPDPFRGLPFATQAAYINQADYLAFRQPRIVSTTQFLINDDRPDTRARRGTRKYWLTFQTGLFTASGQAKPALDAYLLPFDIRRSGGSLRAWGQLRFTKNGAPQLVAIQFRPAGGSNWRTVANQRVTNSVGMFEATVPDIGGASWRALWTSPDGAERRSSRITVPR
ncbi:MAG: hypothetical protein WD649_01630 [Thermoleophilaceae bacterium]